MASAALRRASQIVRTVSLKALVRIALPLLGLWLLVWIALSWGAIQDDALIHLRYADFLHRLHFITYDGVHPSYGTSSLLYVSLLALLRTFTQSPNLPRAVSTVSHLALFSAFAVCCVRAAKGASARVQIFALTLLLLLVAPSATRWLEDGMETSLVLCLVSLVVWQVYRLSLRPRIRPGSYLLCASLGFFLVVLRNEMVVVACFATAVLCLAKTARLEPGWVPRVLRSMPSRSSFLVGAVFAALAIRVVMHSFLPDTALAKSHGFGQFFPSLWAGGTVIAGALLFGMGTLALWLLSAVVVLTQPGVRTPATLAANLIFPVVLLASALRGQEIQGVRYLVWTFFFSILWNLLELWRLDAPSPKDAASLKYAPGHRGPKPFAVLAALCLLALPIESRLMHRALTARVHTMNAFLHHPALLTAMPGQMGIAFDIGYISYYTGDRICDLAGLVNGPGPAALTEPQRETRCAAQNPAFLFLNTGQAVSLQRNLDFAQWVVCGQYDLGNMSEPDRHYLIVRPDFAAAVCHATGFEAAPASYALIARRYD